MQEHRASIYTDSIPYHDLEEHFEPRKPHASEMLFRLKCHFCGTRSKASQGTTEFQCQSCEAWNFFNKKGEVVDPPARVAAAPRSQPAQMRPSQKHAQPGSNAANFTPQALNETFCQICLTNQRIYTESIASYLPDEDHPQYDEYERKLPMYKADLERRYPQICKKCAPKVQAAIARADKYGLQQNVAKNMRETQRRRGRSNKGQRDDWGKWCMRIGLRLLGWSLYASLLVQVTWHAYSLCMTLRKPEEMLDPETDFFNVDDLAFDPTPPDCARELLRLRFYKPCLGMLASIMPRTLQTSLLLIWYTPGLALWYHHTIRVESVHGRSQYLLMQLILLCVRTFAWLNLSNRETTSHLTRPQLLAAHGFMIAFMLVIHIYSERVIRYDAWKIKGKMMRGPDEVDAFGAFAGPEKDTSPPQASSIPPVRLFERNNQPFNIESLAPRAAHSTTNRNIPYQPPPSPPDSQSVSDDEMDDQMDWQPSTKPQMPGAPNTAIYNPRTSRSQHNNASNATLTPSKGWTPMRNVLFGIQSQQTTEEQRQHEAAEAARVREQELRHRSPFRGSLPPDPMQRRLRSTQPQLQKRQPPVSEQPDFYARMSQSFGSQRFGGKKMQAPGKTGALERETAKGKEKNVRFDSNELGAAWGLSLNEGDEDFSPVKNRHGKASSGLGSGSMQFRQSAWTLPDKTEATGLEDLFGGRSFRIGDEMDVGSAIRRVEGSGFWSWKKVLMMLAVVPVAAFAVGWNIADVRRRMCLWLVERLEESGY